MRKQMSFRRVMEEDGAVRKGRERRGRGWWGGRKRGSGHNVPITLVVHLPVVNKAGQGRESKRQKKRREKERGGDQVAQSNQP